MRRHSFTNTDIDDMIDAAVARRNAGNAMSASSVEPFQKPDHKAKKHPRPFARQHGRRADMRVASEAA